ncbi:MAG: HDOD domain-containing protein [Gammaproteobacteria bacterium]|nr:HDOD domain-containing protein [Gammaproteobacteria bacterium]
MKAAQQFIANLAESISMPQIYLDIRQLIKQPDASINDYVELISEDSILSSRILRIANSEFFGFSRKVDTLTQGLNLIGIIQLHDLLLSSLCMRTFSSIPTEVLNLKAFWHYSTQCGIASRIIAQHSFSPISNHYFTLGLMHEIGHAAMYSKNPELSFKALEDSMHQNRPLQELESEYFDFDYTQAGNELMQLWHLPDVYQQVASYHLNPELASEQCQFEVQIVHLAHTICQHPVNNEHQQIISGIRENFPQLKNLPANIDNIIIKELKEYTDTVLNILWPDVNQQILVEDGLLNGE